MKKGKFYVLLFVITLIFSLPLVAQGFPALGYDEVANQISGNSAMNFIDNLDNWQRIAGSDAEKDAADYIETTLSDLGYVTEQQNFPILYYEEKEWRLTVVEPSETYELNPNIMTYSPEGDVTANLIYCNLGYPGDFPKDAQGYIALIKRGELYFSEKVANAAAAGAVGAVIFNKDPGNFFGTLGSPADIPAVSISLEEGTYLQSLIDQNDTVTANLYVDAIMEDRESQNVIATKYAPRDVGTGHTIIIGGHYDNVSAGFGANDNASGTAVMMEVANVLSNIDLNADVKFIAFGAEEIGLYGSEYYVNNMTKEEIKKTRAMINLDMVGVGSELTAGDMRKNDGWLVKYIERYGEALGQEVVTFEAEENSDHAFFEYAGIPVCFMIWETDPYYHTAEDTLDKISSDNLEIVGKISAAAIYDLANTPPPRSTEEFEPAIANQKVKYFKGKLRDSL